MPVNPIIDGSISEMISALADLKSTAFLNGTWLNARNRYTYNIIETYEADLRKTPARIYHKYLREYTSASSVLHCSDGWTFLSKAISSILEGDIPSAIFFTYYTELRALMSLFATNGISILNRKHVCINSSGKAVPFTGQGTHAQVRVTLNDYIANPQKTELLMDWLSVDNVTLKEWVKATGALTSGYLAQDWLSKWSVDITQIEADHDSRNQVSYRPQKLTNALYNFTYKDDILKIISFWELCEPSVSNNFYLLDRYLLRISLEELFNVLPYRVTSSNGKRNKTSKTYKNAIKKFILKASKSLSRKPTPSLIRFLTREDLPDDNIIFVEANKPCYDKLTKKYDVIPMIARALMLMRIATGGCNHLIKNAAITKADLEFWWADFGNKYAFWDFGVLPTDLKDDLWPDIADAIANLKQFCNANVVNNQKDLDGFDTKDLNSFKQINKIPLWAIGL